MYNLQQLREQRGKTQSELAREIGETAQEIAAYENGWLVPTVQAAYAMAAALGCTLDCLMGHKRCV